MTEVTGFETPQTSTSYRDMTAQNQSDETTQSLLEHSLSCSLLTPYN